MKNEERDIYTIPPNFIEGGTLLGGMFRTRNVVEAGILAVAIGGPVLSLHFSLTVRIIILCLTALPLALVALIGINGSSLSSFFIQLLSFLRNRRVLSADEPADTPKKILGNCDVQLFLGCTDALTAQFISDRTGEASISVTSKAKQLGTWRISNYTPEYRETSGVGRRKLMTMDEVLRMDTDKALVIIRGKNVLEVDKYDYSKHPEAKKLRPSKAAAHIPEWKKAKTAPASRGKKAQPSSSKKAKGKAAGGTKHPAAKPASATPPAGAAGSPTPGAAARGSNIVTTTKKSILVKQKEE